MMPDVSEIRRMRKNLGITQNELAKESGVSQSLIAKIESGKIVPSYKKARRLFETLERAEKKESASAKEIMSKKPGFVKETDSAKKAVSAMEKNGFSQLPVITNSQCVGVVTERGALSALRKMGSEFEKARVGEIMDPPLTIVSETAAFPLLAGILNHEQAILVSSKGKIVGIITKSDLLKSALGKKN